MTQTEQKKSSKRQEEIKDSCEYLYFLGVKYPYRDVEGMKVSTERLENVLLNSMWCPEAHELMEEIVYFCREEDLFALGEDEIMEILIHENV